VKHLKILCLFAIGITFLTGCRKLTKDNTLIEQAFRSGKQKNDLFFGTVRSYANEEEKPQQAKRKLENVSESNVKNPFSFKLITNKEYMSYQSFALFIYDTVYTSISEYYTEEKVDYDLPITSKTNFGFTEQDTQLINAGRFESNTYLRLFKDDDGYRFEFDWNYSSNDYTKTNWQLDRTIHSSGKIFTDIDNQVTSFCANFYTDNKVNSFNVMYVDFESNEFYALYADYSFEHQQYEKNIVDAVNDKTLDFTSFLNYKYSTTYVAKGSLSSDYKNFDFTGYLMSLEDCNAPSVGFVENDVTKQEFSSLFEEALNKSNVVSLRKDIDSYTRKKAIKINFLAKALEKAKRDNTLVLSKNDDKESIISLGFKKDDLIKSLENNKEKNISFFTKLINYYTNLKDREFNFVADTNDFECKYSQINYFNMLTYSSSDFYISFRDKEARHIYFFNVNEQNELAFKSSTKIHQFADQFDKSSANYEIIRNENETICLLYAKCTCCDELFLVEKEVWFKGGKTFYTINRETMELYPYFGQDDVLAYLPCLDLYYVSSEKQREGRPTIAYRITWDMTIEISYLETETSFEINIDRYVDPVHTTKLSKAQSHHFEFKSVLEGDTYKGEYSSWGGDYIGGKVVISPRYNSSGTTDTKLPTKQLLAEKASFLFMANFYDLYELNGVDQY